MGEITLYTPNTGLPDLELKIAYGLCRVAFEADLDFEMRPREGFWSIAAQGEHDLLEVGFRGILSRMMSVSEFFLLPGLGGRAKPQDMVYKHGTDIPLLEDMYETEPIRSLSYKATTGFRICGHLKTQAFGGSSGLFLGAGFGVGKPTKRDQMTKSNLGLCEICGWLATLGYHSVALRFSAGDSRVVVFPQPEGTVDRDAFQNMLSMQRDLGWSAFPPELGLRDLPLVILARYPHLSDFMTSQNLNMGIYILKRNSNGSWGICDAWSSRIDGYAGFIKGQSESYEPRNIALVQKMSQNINDTKGVFPLLSKALNSGDAGERRRFAALFARELVANMNKDSEWVFLLPKNTAKYLLEEVMMIKPELYKNRAIRAVAALLRHFVTQRNFGFVDRLRSAKENSHEFEEVIETMLRQAQVASEGTTYIPGPEKISTLMELAENDFEGVRHAILILGLSRGHTDEDQKEAS